ncbi:hypothetical protein [Levilactobacillus lindianensis]|uniref:hypothetical protein n=1 Tax=Levilactobacillus lindianensis TaxID=2486018 RepID=UPI000F739A03|nr:hypothetical protein [Levilactobacillus lindianensis]
MSRVKGLSEFRENMINSGLVMRDFNLPLKDVNLDRHANSKVGLKLLTDKNPFVKFMKVQMTLTAKRDLCQKLLSSKNNKNISDDDFDRMFQMNQKIQPECTFKYRVVGKKDTDEQEEAAYLVSVSGATHNICYDKANSIINPNRN